MSELAISDLIAYTGSHPKDRDPNQLASRFGLDVSLVHLVLKCQKGKAGSATALGSWVERFVSPVLDPIASILRRFPVVSIVFITAVSIIILTAHLWTDVPLIPTFDPKVGLWFGILAPVWIVIPVACILAADWTFFSLSVVCRYLCLTAWFCTMDGVPTLNDLLLAMGMAGTSLLVGVIDPLLATVFGFKLRETQFRRIIQSGNRKAMLRRLMETRRLAVTNNQRSDGWVARLLLREPKARQIAYTLIVTLALSCYFIVMIEAFGDRARQELANHQIEAATSATLAAALTLCYVALATLACAVSGFRFKSPMRSFIISLLVSVIFTIADAGVLGKDWATFGIVAAVYSVRGTVAWLVGRLARAGYLISSRTLRWLTNDPEYLIAESKLLEYHLSSGAQKVSLLCVDVVGSTSMKQFQDSLGVEYSFQEYQEFVSSICQRNNGRIHSTAGDGAIAVFMDGRQCLAAALQIQDEISTFNRTISKLTVPFRLRIGLHTGPMYGDVSDMRFTIVIDTCSHVERMSPPDGIAVSREFADQVPEIPFTDLGTTAEGEMVLTADMPGQAVGAESPPSKATEQA